MAKKTKNAADVQGLSATPTITIEDLKQDIEQITPEVNKEIFKEVKEGLKKIIKFEYENCQDCAQDALLVDMDEFYFNVDDATENIHTMYDLSEAYSELDGIKDDSKDSGNYDYIEDIIGSEGCYYALTKENEEEFVKAYSELGIDEAVLKRIAKIVLD